MKYNKIIVIILKLVSKEKNCPVISEQNLNYLIKREVFVINAKEKNLFICVLLTKSLHPASFYIL